jgi:hypothetical protein
VRRMFGKEAWRFRVWSLGGWLFFGLVCEVGKVVLSQEELIVCGQENKDVKCEDVVGDEGGWRGCAYWKRREVGVVIAGCRGKESASGFRAR